MAYNKRNHILKRQHALEITRQFYEPGRQDRCYRWVWQKHIKDLFHIEYNTYMEWLREERAREAERTPTLFDQKNEEPRG